MSHRLLVAMGRSAAVAALLTTAQLQAQGPGTATTATAKTARTPDGQPDLQGVWTFATATPLERPAEYASKEFLTEQEVAAFEKQVLERQDVDVREESSLGTDADVGRAYNQFWWDRGTKVVGTRRTSLIIKPKDGKIPAMTADAQTRMERAGRRGNPPAGPEDRSLWERCITHSPLPRMTTGYNNNLQIFQGPGYVAIVYEMIHEARF